MGIVCRWFRRLFGHKREMIVETPTTEVAPVRREREPKIWLPPRGRNVQTSRRDLPNAPKKQPCRSCGKWVRRTRKTRGLAFYWCNKCKVETVIKLRR